MTNWLTTQYPHPEGHPWHIYLQRQHKDAVSGIQVGDRVFFYEYARQKPIRDGITYPKGRQAIVVVAYVSGPIYHRDTVIEYADGTTGYWSWGIPTDKENHRGFVSRVDLCRILNYSKGYRLRGFEGGTGIKRLEDSDGSTLYGAFSK